MAKASRYEALVGSVVNGVLVVSYKREPRTSKSGRNYTVGRLYVCYYNRQDIVIDIAISSWNKQTFYKTLDKAVNGTTSKTKQQTKTKTTGKQAGKQTKTTNTHDSGATINDTEEARKVMENFFKQTKTTSKTTSSKQAGKQTKTTSKQSKTTGKQQTKTLEQIVQDIQNMAKQDAIREVQEDIEMWEIKGGFDNMSSYGTKLYNTPQQMIYKYVQIEAEFLKDKQTINEAYTKAGLQNMFDLFEQVYTEARLEQYKLLVSDWVNSNWQVFEDNFYKKWEEENIKQKQVFVDNEFTPEFKNCKTIKEVKSVYRRLAKQYHSDLGGNDSKFTLVQQAYEQAKQRVA